MASSSRRAAAGARGAGAGRGRQAEEGAGRDDEAGILPADLKAALQALDEEVGKLFATFSAQGSDSGGPLASASAARLRRLGKALDAVCEPPGAAAAILAWAPGRSALLRLLAAALRLPVHDWFAGLAAADGSARHLRANVARRAVDMVAEQLLGVVNAGTPASRPAQSFLRAAVRTQALHAASRQLAALGEALAPTAGGAVGGAADVVAGADGQPGDKETVVDVATSLLDFTYAFLRALTASLPLTALEEPNVPPSAQPVVTEFMEALESSQVLEHAARVLLLALVGAAHNGGGGGGPMLPPDSVIAFRRFFNVHTYLLVHLCKYCGSANGATAAMGTRLRSALCGRCVTHTALVLGLSTLVSTDGGSSYGLDEIVRMPAVRAVAGEWGGAGATGSDSQPGEEALIVMALQLLALSNAVPRPPARPCRCGVFSMALRIGRLDVESGLLAAAAAAQASGGGGGPQPPRPLAPPPQNWWTGFLTTVAFEIAVLQLYPLDPIGGLAEAVDAGAELELWRLGVSALRWALPRAVEQARLQTLCRLLRYAWRRGEQGNDEAAGRGPLHLPPSPPRPVSAALSGGLLPCLEYLLRSAGRDPAGSWQAAAVRDLAAWLGAQLAPLLAYGDEREAAALVATLGKLLRRALANPRVLEGAWEPQANFWQAVLSIVSALISDFCDDHDPSNYVATPEGGALEPFGPPEAEPEPEAAAAGGVAEAVEAAPQPAAFPASQQLASLLTFAVCHWLPPLSHLAQAALASGPPCADPACGLGGDGSGSGGSGGGGSGGGGSGGGGFAPKTATYLLYASLDDEGGGRGGDGGWLTLLLEDAAVGQLQSAAQEHAPGLQAAGLGDSLLPPLAKLVARCRGHVAALRSPRPSSGGASAGFEGADGRGGSGGGGSGAAGQGSAAPRPSLVAEAEAEIEAAARSSVEGQAEDGGCDDGGGGGDGAAGVPEPAEDPALRRLASVMPPPAAARRLLRTCANPGCANLEGDSEAGLRLTPCAGCGEAAYCCRDCWTAHWRAGHRAACARRRLDAGGRREEPR
ncbi:hypothetical protein GPECTOR_37g164 [Gonium pectorale]|uniref:phytol kinase n=1 Tax=Gonium pectorale TaxID=33097 RepID=A0A150GBF6_GONPE|nr:hypothetical protein GPECTOR_37g164 [Gonium pectorale]|eukprot:KXZ47158.1 hypothetical protein GPECTOR_37g164 [Gonium pectorale]